MRLDARAAIARLEAAGVAGAARDFRVLFDEAFAIGGATRDHPQTRERPNAVTLEILDLFLGQRARRVPVSQIIGRRAFWRHEFVVTADVLDPRPETETLVEAALSEPFKTVLDLGTGSGCILLSLLAERPKASGVGVDKSAKALAVAAQNAAKLGLTERVSLLDGSWFSPVRPHFELIVSNPPYIPLAEMDSLAPEVNQHEPEMALTDGVDGLTAFKNIFEEASDYLAPGGSVMVEFGWGQGPDVERIAQSYGWTDTMFRADLGGKDRVLVAKAPR